MRSLGLSKRTARAMASKVSAMGKAKKATAKGKAAAERGCKVDSKVVSTVGWKKRFFYP